MKSTSLPCSVRNTNRSLVSSKLSVPDIFLLYPKTPPSYFALTLGGAGGGAGMFVAGWFASWLAVRGRCANAVAAIKNARIGMVDLSKIDIGVFDSSAEVSWFSNQYTLSMRLRVATVLRSEEHTSELQSP